jgi:hypothetical protein
MVEMAPSMIVSDSGEVIFCSGSTGEAGELNGAGKGGERASDGRLVTGISTTCAID